MRHASHTFLLTIAAVTLLVVAGVYLYMLNAAKNSIAASIAARESVAAAESNKTRNQAFMAAYQASKDEWSKLPSYFIPSDNILVFINSIEGLGRATSASTTLINLDADNLEGAATGTLGIIRARVQAHGTWSAVMRILSMAELMPYKDVINNVQLQSESGTGKHLWDMSFDIKATMIVMNAGTKH